MLGIFGQVLQISYFPKTFQKDHPSGPPLDWSKNRRCAKNEPYKIPAFLKIAFKLASPNLMVMPDHLTQICVDFETSLCFWAPLMRMPARITFGDLLRSAARKILRISRSRDLGCAGYHMRDQPSTGEPLGSTSAGFMVEYRRFVSDITDFQPNYPAYQVVQPIFSGINRQHS